MKKASLKDPNCIEAAVTVLGDKWSPLLIRALSSQSRRFCQLQSDVGNVNPRTLSTRLSKLEDLGIIIRLTYPEVPPRVEYSLTKKGHDLLPVLIKMAAWSEQYSS